MNIKLTRFKGSLISLLCVFSLVSWTSAQSNKLCTIIQAPPTATLNETDVAVTVKVTPVGGFTFVGKSDPTLDIYFGRADKCYSSSCAGPDCYVLYSSSNTMIQPADKSDKREYSFTYNQSNYNRPNSADQSFGYNFVIKAVVSCSGETAYNTYLVGVKKLYGTAKVKKPINSTCYSTSASLPKSFDLSDSYRYSNTTHILKIAGPSYEQLFSISTSSFNSVGSYSQSIPTISVAGIYNWTLTTKASDDETSAGVLSDGGLFYYYPVAGQCNCLKMVYTLFPNETQDFPTLLTPDYKTPVFQEAHAIKVLVNGDGVKVTSCGSNKWILTRNSHQYYLKFNTTQKGPFSPTTMDSKYVEPFTAPSTTGTYTFTYWVTYKEDAQYLDGTRPACETWPKTRTKQITTYPVDVSKIKIQTGKDVKPKSASSIQDAFNKCNADNGGEIWVLESYNSGSTDNIVSIGDNPIKLNVRSPTGYKINGKLISEYFNGDMSGSYTFSQFGYIWYSVTLNPGMFPKTAVLSGDLSSWPINLNASQQVDVSSATIGSGVAKNIGSAGAININGSTTISNGGSVNIKIDPTIK